MNVSSAQTAKAARAVIAIFQLILVISLGGLLTIPVSVAYANSRMAGGKIYSSYMQETKDTHSFSRLYKAISEQDLFYIETLGTQTQYHNSSLGTDMWNGSSYNDILELLDALPVSGFQPALYDLQTYMLLGKADSRLLKRDRHTYKSGHSLPDIFTLRIEKLNRIGAFKEAVDLYAKSAIPPYNERLARAAIMAMIHARHTGQACLEIQMLEPENKSSHDIFWKKLEVFCAYTLSLKLPRNHGVTGIIAELVNNKDYTYSPENIEELLSLENVEKAILFNRNKIDYSHITKFNEPDNIPLHDLSLLLDDPNLPSFIRSDLLNIALAKGLRKRNDIAEFYMSLEFPLKQKDIENFEALDKTLETLADWQKIPFLYQLFQNTEKNDSHIKIIEKALQQNSLLPYAAFSPFATDIQNYDLSEFSYESLQKLFPILLKILPDEKIKIMNWKNIITQEEEKKGEFNCHNDNYREGIEDNFIDINDQNAKETALDRPSSDTNLCSLMLKLDKYEKLHNYGGVESYEKQKRLTFGDDYVMPFVDFIDRLDDAEKNNRHAEVVLLSILVFQNEDRQEEIPLSLLKRVTDALETVGLIEVSRALLLNAVAKD